MEWSGCEDVEREAGKVSGAWVVRSTRVPGFASPSGKAGSLPEQNAAVGGGSRP